MTLSFDAQKRTALAEPNFTVASSEAGRLVIAGPAAALLVQESLRRIAGAPRTAGT